MVVHLSISILHTSHTWEGGHNFFFISNSGLPQNFLSAPHSHMSSLTDISLLSSSFFVLKSQESQLSLQESNLDGQIGLDLKADAVPQQFGAKFSSSQRLLLSGCSTGQLALRLLAWCSSAAPHWLRAEVEKEPAPGCNWARWSAKCPPQADQTILLFGEDHFEVDL